MPQSTVVLALTSPRSAEVLAVALHSYFETVAVVHAPEHLQPALLKFRANVAIVDLEMVGLKDVEALHRDFPHVLLVCTHRVPDEAMWAAALSGGAADCFPVSDVRNIVAAAVRTPGPQQTHNAA
ncbi:MAG: hypothetical protein L0099_15695 [Acidobacteria bacterium]|nr:hypothetical protein [Acidobacteriota bacterium]